jgi:chemotaxis protein histidine kinase CheA
LKAQAHYNVGVCQFRQAMQASEAGDFQKALDLLQACMDSNRQALKLRPDDNDAKYNFEQAKRAWKELFDKLKQQQQQNPQQNEKQGQQDQQQQQQENGQSQDPQRQQQQQQGQQQEGEKQDQQGAQPTPTPAPASAPQASKDQTAQSKPSEQGQQQQQGQGELTEEQARRILNRLGEENAKAFMELMRPPGMPVQRWQNDW